MKNTKESIPGFEQINHYIAVIVNLRVDVSNSGIFESTEHRISLVEYWFSILHNVSLIGLPANIFLW